MCVTPSEPVLCSVFTSGNEIPPHFVLNTEAALYQLEIAHNAALPSLPLTCRHLTSHAPNSRLDHHRQRIKMVCQLVHRTTVSATGAKKVIWHASTLTDGSLHKLNTIVYLEQLFSTNILMLLERKHSATAVLL